MADFMSKLKTVAIKKKNRMYIDQSSDVSTVDWFVWSDYALLIDRTERHAFESRLLCCCEKTVCSSFKIYLYTRALMRTFHTSFVTLK